MPEEKKKGNIATRKIGPQPAWAWFAEGVVAFLIYRAMKVRRAARNASAATALSGGNTIPPGVTTTSTGGVTSTAPGNYSTYQEWLQAAVTQLAGQGMNGADALNAIQSWLNGGCVTQAAYKAISGLLTTTGLPPGWGTSLPTLSVCSSPASNPPGGSGGGGALPTPQPIPTAPAQTLTPPAATPPPGLPAALIASMTNNGEHLVDTQYDPVTGGWVYLTSKGGIYNEGGSPFYGSIFSLGDNFANWFTSGGQQIRTAARLVVNPDGGYTIVDTAGESYTFGPQANYATAGH